MCVGVAVHAKTEEERACGVYSLKFFLGYDWMIVLHLSWKIPEDIFHVIL